MVFDGNVSLPVVSAVTNASHLDVKAALKFTQQEISDLISDLGDPSKTTITINGQVIKKSDTVTLTLAVNNKMDNLSNQSTTILGVFNELFRLEKSITS